MVAKVRGQVKQATGQKKPKVGHAGTLDPLATGLLTILIGSYCKKAADYSKLDKTYEVEVTLGKTSSTDDAEGEITTNNSSLPQEDEIKQVILSFVGEIQQVPPAFSAIKVNGKRAYKLAREGKEVELKPRQVTVHSLQITEMHLPVVKFTVHVSSGTYIRSLARDIGEKLGIGAYMSGLRRTQVGRFDIKDAHQIGDISPETLINGMINR